jgi:DNA repair protein RecN (Recombination protein N)
MIERFYLKEFLTFKEVELEFNPGLIVFTGPSGSGKSILMRSILASVGLDGVEAQVCESNVLWQLDEDKYGIQNETVNTFRHVKKDKTRYFINNQSTSKSSMETISSEHIRHLSLKDYSDFEPSALMQLLDKRICRHTPGHRDTLERHKALFGEYKVLKDQLHHIEDQEKHLSELKEFAAYEISKIDAIKPKIGEDEELTLIKKQLSKKEKIEQSIRTAEAIFAYESHVSNALTVLEVESAFFDDAMNELRGIFETSLERLGELEDISIEGVLDRIELLSELKRRYGGVSEALFYREQKAAELASYETIEHSKGDLVKNIAAMERELETLSRALSLNRHKELSSALTGLNGYLGMLYLREATLELHPCEHYALGTDKAVLGLAGTKLDKLSSGEFNRLRLALLALRVESMPESGGVLILDEIDANLSGEESMSVAKVLRHLSGAYQIFVISHQPQLTSMGNQHFLVYKEGESRVRVLSDAERIEEIARIISGEGISDEALGFAKDLFERSRMKL